MTPNMLGKSRVYVRKYGMVMWRKGEGRFQVFVPTTLPHQVAWGEPWFEWTSAQCPLDVEHDDQDEIAEGTRLTVFGNTFMVTQLQQGHPFAEINTVWVEPWTHWHKLRE